MDKRTTIFRGGAAQPPVKKKKKKWPFFVGGAVGLLIIIIALFSGSGDSESNNPEPITLEEAGGYEQWQAGLSVDYLEMGLYDIDKDGIAELFIEKGSGGADTVFEVYRTNGYETQKLGEVSGANTLLHESGQDGFYTNMAHMGYQLVNYVWIENGQLEQITIFEGYVEEFGDELPAIIPTNPIMDIDYDNMP